MIDAAALLVGHGPQGNRRRNDHVPKRPVGLRLRDAATYRVKEMTDQFKGFLTRDGDGPVEGPQLTFLWAGLGILALVLLAVRILV